MKHLNIYFLIVIYLVSYVQCYVFGYALLVLSQTTTLVMLINIYLVFHGKKNKEVSSFNKDDMLMDYLKAT